MRISKSAFLQGIAIALGVASVYGCNSKSKVDAGSEAASDGEESSLSIQLAGDSPTRIVVGSSVLVSAHLNQGNDSTDVTTGVEWFPESPAVCRLADGASADGKEILALRAGDCSVKAKLGDSEGTLTLAIVEPGPVSLSIAPEQFALGLGESGYFSADVTFEDGTKSSPGSGLTWTCSVATCPVEARGDTSLVAVAPGAAILTATYAASGLSVSKTVAVTVSNAKPKQLLISSDGALSLLGQSRRFFATALYTDGTARDVTAAAKWSSTNGSVVTVSNTVGSEGLARAHANGTTRVSAVLDGVSVDYDLTLASAELLSIAVKTPSVSVPIGYSVPLSVIGSYADGSTLDLTSAASWTSSDSAALAVDEGIAAGLVQAASVTAEAAVLGKTSTVTLAVTNEVLDRLRFVPDGAVAMAQGSETTVAVRGFFSGGTILDLTSASTLATSTPSVVKLSSRPGAVGTVVAEAQGSTTVSATLGAITASVAIVVTTTTLSEVVIEPAALSLVAGSTVPLRLVAVFSDASRADVTDLAVWTSSSVAVAVVKSSPGGTGGVTGVSAGTATISASYLGKTGTAALTVTATPTGSPNVPEVSYTSLRIVPDTLTLAKGEEREVKVYGRANGGTSEVDVTSLALFQSSASSVATITGTATPGWHVRAFGAGTATLTAKIGTTTADMALTVTAKNETELVLFGAEEAPIVGSAFSLVVRRYYSDGTFDTLTSGVTWQSSATSVATVTAGAISVIDSGNATITATSGSLSVTLDMQIPVISLTVTAPNGGESWSILSTRTITWSSSGFAGNVGIDVSRDGGATWATVVASTANDGSHAWSVAGPASSSVLLRVKSVATPSIVDVSDADAAIFVPALRITAPNGGETRYQGQSTTVTWDAAGLSGNVKLEVTYDNGSNWSILTASVDGTTGTYDATLASLSSNAAKVRITHLGDAAVTDASDATFSVVAPFISLSAPNGGESWDFGTNETITWMHGGVSGTVKIELSVDNGSNWTALASSVAVTAGTYTHAVTQLATSQALVRITSNAVDTITDTSAAPFSIANVPSITVSAPNGGESIASSRNQSITWSVSGTLSGTVSILLSKDGGSTFETTLASNVSASAGTYTWDVLAAHHTTQGRVRIVSNTYSAIADASNANFSVAAPFIEVTSPNGGESWVSGGSQSVTWTSVGVTGNVKIELSTDGGSTYGTVVAASVTNNGSYTWSVPQLDTTTARIKVSSVDETTLADTSNANFTLFDGSVYIIRGSTTASTIDGATQTICGGDGLCPNSGDAYTIPNGVLIASLELRNGAYVVLPASSTATIRHVTIDNSSTLVVNKAATFSSLTVTNGTVTTTAYAGTWNGSAWSSAPGAGNGRLHLTVTGALIVGASGSISVDAMGYPSGGAGQTGQSYNGRPGAGGGVSGWASGAYFANGATYGSTGSGSALAPFGATDFTSALYLGSSGGGGTVYNSDNSDDHYSGGSGGGVIVVAADSLTNQGVISANGQNAPAGFGGGGSGGTVSLTVTGAMANTGTIRARGGSGTGGGGAGGVGRIYIGAGSLGPFSGSVDPTPHKDFFTEAGLDDVDSITLTSTGMTLVVGAKTYNLGTASDDVLDAYAGHDVDALTISSGTFTLSAASIFGSITVAGGTLNVNTTPSGTPDLLHTGGTIYLNAAATFDDVSIGIGGSAAVVTTKAYNGTWNGSAWSTAPTFGNGRLKLTATGAMTIGPNGSIVADSLGYPSGGAGQSGLSYSGKPGAGGGVSGGVNGVYFANGATYGSTGSGSALAPFGATDFTSALYLGSSGGGGSVYNSDNPDDHYNGGAGGGVIVVAADSLTNQGVISANGQTVTAGFGGGGSGGTVVITVTGSLANTGTIRARGGSGASGGGAGGVGRIYIGASSLGTFSGMVDPVPHADFLTAAGLDDVDSIVLTSTTMALTVSGKTYNLGTPDVAVLNAYSGHSVDALTINSGTFSIGPATTFGTITIGGGNVNFNDAVIGAPDLVQTAGTIYLNAAQTFGNVDIGLGGTAAVVTTTAYSGTWSGTAWSSAPGFGNGRLKLTATGTMTIGTNGSIVANGLGYRASTVAGRNGFSFDGQPGTGGGRGTYDVAGGGAYGTVGGGTSGSVFGAADFATALYLGSSGGGGSRVGYDSPDEHYLGANGGGAIVIQADALSNQGLVSADGNNAPAGFGGGGSGGTVVISVTSELSNTGTIRALGGSGSGGGGAGGVGRLRVTSGSTGTMSGTINPASS